MTNARVSKALRREAKRIADSDPQHAEVTYTNIVREWIERRIVDVKEGVVGKISRWLRGKKAPPKKTKEVEVVTRRSFQTVLTTGWKFILRRLKTARRRGQLSVHRNEVVVIPQQLWEQGVRPW